MTRCILLGVALLGLAHARAEAQSVLQRRAATADLAARAEAARANAELRGRGLPLPFMPTSESVTFDTTRDVANEHPCGFTLTMRLKRIPARHPVLLPEVAIEYDRAGHALRRWRYPSDMVPVAIEGDVLVVSFPEDRTSLGVRPDGRFEVLPRLAFDSPWREPCPTLAEFRESAYATCEGFRDLATRQPRRIAYEGPCS